ncbi:DUF7882 family protein [Microbacterium sp. GXF0217]
MGSLIYGNDTTPFEVEDELLAHLRLVIVTKLRRNESFALTLRDERGALETLWLHAAIPLRFILDESLELHRPLVVEMMNAASSSGGLDLTRDMFTADRARPRELQPMGA